MRRGSDRSGFPPDCGLVGLAALSSLEPRKSASPPAMPHFQIVTEDGEVLGAQELSGPDWPPGSIIYTGPNTPNLRVVRELDTGNDDTEMHFTVLVVEPF